MTHINFIGVIVFGRELGPKWAILGRKKFGLLCFPALLTTFPYARRSTDIGNCQCLHRHAHPGHLHRHETCRRLEVTRSEVGQVEKRIF